MPVMVGLTGGIASGKSTASRMFTELGAYVIDADQIARQVVEPGKPALDDIRSAFGEGVIASDGSLDREQLGKIVFTDPDARSRLGQITHPRIARAMMEEAAFAEDAGHAWVIYDAALIVENNMHAGLAALIVVSLDPEVQLERLLARDGFSLKQARARVDSQLPLADKVAVADYVIDNSGSLEATRAQVTELYNKIDGLVATHGVATLGEEGRHE